MRVTFLGTGTSHGIPVIACSCPVCQSKDARDKRYRSSLLIEDKDTSIVIDTGYEFRLSLIRENVRKLDAVLYTHSHSDHIAGLDDLRVFTRDESLPLYAGKSTLDHIKTVFDYAFYRHAWHHEDSEDEMLSEMRKHNYGLPLLVPNEVKPFEEFQVKDMKIKAIPLMHGMMEVFGYRIKDFAYLTDVSYISDESIEALKGVRIIVLGALREKSHPTHFTFKEAESLAKRLNVDMCYFTHINHETSHEEINRRYAPLCQAAYDGLKLEV